MCVPGSPFSMKEIMPPLGKEKPELMQAMIDLSRSNYAKPKAQVDADIAKNLGI